MLKKVNVLIFPAGAELALEIYNSLRYNLHVEVFGASGKPDHAKYVYDKQHYFEDDYYITKPDFIARFNKLITKLKIDFVFPAHDTIALFLAQHSDKINATIITSPYQTTLIAREKRRTYDIFKKFDFCPQIYSPPFDDLPFPVFLKPNIGQGAKGASIIENKETLQQKVAGSSDLIVCEYLPGEELGVDCFSNRKGDLQFIGPRTRERVQMGISFHSSSVPITSQIQEIAEAINKTVAIRGTWFFQVKKDKKGRYKLMEFAVRHASTMGLYRQLGVNFALLSIFDEMDIDVRILKNDLRIELDRCLFNRYKIDFEYNAVFIDFDDTLIANNKVNEVAIKYLYKCKNNNIKTYLLTKHELDLDESLKKYCIAKNLFNEIILLKSSDDKAKFINPHKSIFIDNYFYDREKVSKELGIPVFDVDAIECLL